MSEPEKCKSIERKLKYQFGIYTVGFSKRLRKLILGWFIVMVTDYREPEISPSGLEWEPPNEVQYLINPQKI